MNVYDGDTIGGDGFFFEFWFLGFSNDPMIRIIDPNLANPQIPRQLLRGPKKGRNLMGDGQIRWILINGVDDFHWQMADQVKKGGDMTIIELRMMGKLEPESPMFDSKNHGFRLRFSLKPIHWDNCRNC